MIGPEMQNEDSQETIEPSIQSSQETEPSGEGLFFRLARKRADYFADIEVPEPDFEIDDLPTRRLRPLLPANSSSTPLNVLPIEEQSTLLLVTVELFAQLDLANVPTPIIQAAPPLEDELNSSWQVSGE